MLPFITVYCVWGRIEKLIRLFGIYDDELLALRFIEAHRFSQDPYFYMEPRVLNENYFLKETNKWEK